MQVRPVIPSWHRDLFPLITCDCTPYTTNCSSVAPSCRGRLTTYFLDIEMFPNLTSLKTQAFFLLFFLLPRMSAMAFRVQSVPAVEFVLGPSLTPGFPCCM